MVSPRGARPARRGLQRRGRTRARRRWRGARERLLSPEPRALRSAAPRRQHPTVLVYHPDHAPLYAKLIRAPRSLTLHVASTADEASRAIVEVDVLYAWKFPPALYANAGRLRWLQAMGAGVDWALVPELPASVTVTRAPGVFGPWMAEYVLGWCLWVTQRVQAYRDAQHQRRWIGDLLPDRLRDKTLAIVGLGDIGRTIARTARGLGARVIGVSRSGRPVAGIARVERMGRAARAMREADFVVVAVPLTPETRGLIGARELAAMRPEAWLLNIARGAVVDEAALLDVLRRRRIAGAVLDVFPAEPLSADHALWSLDNVVITPHIAGPSTPEEIAPIFNDNLGRFLAGRRLRHLVDRARGY